jgi:hypothetical protein
MAIMSQILGSSFGRNPAQMMPGGIQHPGMQMPQMYAAPQRPTGQMMPMGTPTSANGNPGAPGPDPQRNPGFDMFRNMLHPGANQVPGAGGNDAGLPGGVAGAPNGIMSQIMQAFNGGAGGGMDIGKLLSMAPMIRGG